MVLSSEDKWGGTSQEINWGMSPTGEGEFSLLETISKINLSGAEGAPDKPAAVAKSNGKKEDKSSW